MKILKGHVRNRHRPKGCIVESYIDEKAVEFCTKYLQDCEAIGIPINRLLDSVDGKDNSGLEMVIVDTFELEQAHLYILHNYVEVVPYVNQHLAYVRNLYANKSKREHWIQNEHTHTFISWFRNHILQELSNPKNTVSETLR